MFTPVVVAQLTEQDMEDICNSNEETRKIKLDLMRKRNDIRAVIDDFMNMTIANGKKISTLLPTSACSLTLSTGLKRKAGDTQEPIGKSKRPKPSKR